MTEAEAIERLKDGDDTVLEFLYKHWRGKFVRSHLRTFRNLCYVSVDEMEDYFRDAMADLAHKAERDELRDYSGDSVKGYVYKHMLNTHRSYCRKHNPRTLTGLEELLASPQAIEIQITVRQILDDISRRCAEMLRLRFMNKWTFREIGEALGLKPDTVRNQLPKCKEDFRRGFNDDAPRSR